MPELRINVEGRGGGFADVFRKYPKQIDLQTPLYIETLDNGLVSGGPSVGLIFELPEQGAMVVAQTSVKLFQMAAFATMSRYGDLTGGSISGLIDKGSAEITMSAAATCPSCSKAIPGSFKFCPHCGVRREP